MQLKLDNTDAFCPAVSPRQLCLCFQGASSHMLILVRRYQLDPREYGQVDSPNFTFYIEFWLYSFMASIYLLLLLKLLRWNP